MKRKIAITTLVAACLALSCGDDGGGDDTVWKEVTTPFDPECKRCIKLGEGALGDIEGVTILVDPDVDDEPAQWNMCLSSLLDCIEEGETKRACVGDSACPDACKRDYSDLAGDLPDDDVDGHWAAINGVFLDPESRCGPPPMEGMPS